MSYNPTNANGQATSANSAPVVIASDQSAIAVALQNLYMTGQAAQTAVVNNILGATAGSTPTDVISYRSFAIQVVSTGTSGTFIFEGSNDGTNFQSVPVYNQAIVAQVPIVSAITASSSNIIYVGATNFRYMRLRIVTTISGGSIQAFSTFTQETFSGTSTLVAQATAANLNTTVSGTVSITGYPTAGTSNDAVSNPSVTKIDAFASNFNGTTWDRERNNVNVTMGDTGAKTATFNGATQTNYNARGAKIMVLCGTVSGTTPTLTAQLQISPDGGTTWISVGAPSTAVTATGNTILIDVYPTNESTAGATPAALAMSATQYMQINMSLPRTWRLQYTIGGTTPSFTLTNAYAAYTN